MLKFFLHINFLFPIFLNAQVNIVNRSLIDSSLNIAYCGVENVIELTGYKGSGKISSLATNGTLTELGQHKYVLKPSKEGDCLISFHNDRKKIITKTFRCDSLKGELKIRLARVTDTVATIHQILANPFLISEIPGSYYKSPVYITSFVATFIAVNFDSLRTEATEHLLTQEQVNIVKQLHRGDKILFQNIYFFWPDGRRRKYPPFVITIK